MRVSNSLKSHNSFKRQQFFTRNRKSLRIQKRSSRSFFGRCSVGAFLSSVIFLQCGGLFLYYYNGLFIRDLRGSNVSLQRPQERPQRRRSLDPSQDKTQKELALDSMRNEFQKLKESKQLHPCKLDGDCVSSKKFSFFRRSTKVLILNPLPENRYFCGKMILGNGGILILQKYPETCQSSVSYLFSPKPPPRSGKGMKPIELYWNTEYYPAIYVDTLKTQSFSCPVSCKTAGDYALLSTVTVKDTEWKISMTMEGEAYYSEAKVMPKDYQQDHYYAVTSFKSEIPVPYFSWSEYQINHPSVGFEKAIKGASFLARNCESINDRESLVLALLDTQLRVDCLSDCLNNAEPPPGVDLGNKTAVLERYLFHLAFENQNQNDYITEKLWGTLASGTLPVYFGAPNIKEHLPPHSVVFVDDFKTPQELANYLIKVSKDKTLYESYHEWRYKPLDPSFRKRYNFTNTHSTCRMCKWAYAKKHGFDWNHAEQEVQEPFIARRTCRNKAGLIGYPFKEYWLSENGGESLGIESKDNAKTCTLDESNRVLTIDGGKVQRKVYNQDGVTDLVISLNGSDQTSYTLKLETPIASDKLSEIRGEARREWWLQDDRSRMTILTSKEVSVSVSKRGTVQMPISSDLRVRVVVENIDRFHEGAVDRANYFGDLMKRDFFHPLEAYKL